MLTKEDIQLISQLLDEKLDNKLNPINSRLDSIEERLDKVDERLEVIEENTEITRVAVNEIIKWIDVNFRDDYPFPVEDKKAI